jgi:Zn-dependent peptidase ImmA (M78 family)
MLRRNREMMQARTRVRPYQVSLPVDVAGISEALGVKVWEIVLPKEISGKLFADPNSRSRFSIGVNQAEEFRRKRFTIAHELAHYLLHQNLMTDGMLQDNTLYRSGLSNHREREANLLAADILMPHHLIRQLIAEDVRNVCDLAARLQVSESAMNIRLGIPVY